MTELLLEYLLHDGYIHNWLVAGPQAIPVPDLARFAGDDLDPQIAGQYHKDLSDIHEPPVEEGTFQIGGQELAWHYLRCLDDHLVDLSGFYPTHHYLRSWAYAQVESPSEQGATFVLTTNGPADVWINRAHVSRQEPFYDQNFHNISFQGTLQEGRNEILVRFEVTAVRNSPYVMAFQIAGVPTHNLSVKLPTYHTNIRRRLKLERVFEQAHLERLVSLRGTDVAFRWDDEVEETDEVGYWIRDHNGLITVFGHKHVQPAATVRLGERRITLEQGPHCVVFIPPDHVIERYHIRYQRRLPFYVLGHAHSGAYYGTYEERRQEALEYCAKRQASLYAAIAKCALGQWGTIDRDTLQRAINGISGRHENSVLDLLGLLGVLHRYPDVKIFAQDTKRAIQDGALGFRYWHDEPGVDAMHHAPEGSAILFHACEILAGQQYPDHTFSSAGHSGQWHREKGERLAREWLRKTGTEGFVEWDSHCCFEQIVVALAHLSDLAEDEEIRELSAIVLDKLFFTIAVNSFKGVFGSTHSQACASMIKGGQLEATSGITRLLWGMGVWNQHISGLVALAVSEYEIPTMIASIAVDLGGEMWHRERHPDVNKATYRTPDYMLCSAQDYRPGETGSREHIWQATLGPDAVVFGTHPSCMSESDAHRPNFWTGNNVLPRVAQWKDVLIAIHRLPQDDRLGFCHAYFPVHEFDEYAIEDGWAFARNKDGYLALTAACGIELVTRGPGAYRELRSYGGQNVWLCHMGRTETDGSFEEFQRKVKALDITLDDLSATCHTLRGETLSFFWEGPFLVDSREQPLQGFKHYDGPSCVADWPTRQMDIRYGEYTLRLDFRLDDANS